jgi:hypothetical protein
MRISILVLFAVTSLPTPAIAEKLGPLVDLIETSRDLTVRAKSEVPLIRVATAPLSDSRAVLSGIVATGVLSPSDLAGDISVVRDSLDDFYSGPGWTARVWRDGTGIVFRKEGIETCSSSIPDKKIALQIARQFLEQKLISMVGLTPNDEAVEIFTRYKRRTAASVDGNIEVREFCETDVAYGRKVGGVHVVGPGSKLIVTVAVSGEIVGFSVDWPHLTISTERQSVGASTANTARLRTIDPRSSQALEAMPECGYFDPGRNKRRNASVLQAGCLIGYKTRTSGSISARIVALPIGEPIFSDPSWAEATYLCSALGGCAEMGSK